MTTVKLTPQMLLILKESVEYYRDRISLNIGNIERNPVRQAENPNILPIYRQQLQNCEANIQLLTSIQPGSEYLLDIKM
jgi:hypothetical protein